jgi:hypothetical protein
LSGPERPTKSRESYFKRHLRQPDRNLSIQTNTSYPHGSDTPTPAAFVHVFSRSWS